MLTAHKTCSRFLGLLGALVVGTAGVSSVVAQSPAGSADPGASEPAASVPGSIGASPGTSLAGFQEPVAPPVDGIPLTSSVFSDSATMDEFLSRVVIANDEYWSLLFTSNGLLEPYVSYRWPAPGESLVTGCVSKAGNVETTDDSTASYCGPDDTIYISQQFAYNLWTGLLTLQGTAPDFNPSDFGLAYVVAHEFGHSIQAELSIVPRGATVKNHELQADCLAGNWANWAYYQNQLADTDVEEAIEAAEWVGDYQTADPAHHGTPTERSEAWRLGYNSGMPSQCDVYNVPA